MTSEAVAKPVSQRALPFGGIDAGALVFVAALGALGLMVVLPLLWLIYTSLQAPDTGSLTWHNYAEAFSKSIYLAPILNSLVLAASVATIAVVLGTPLAWLIARTNLPARGLLRSLIIAAFVTPPFLGAQAWM
ncbi:MAG: iron ABC transporter permease, partial [Candidatus Eremiobacteraeota bacterium]|nr:iron ABC transporter permease [Candidatus Eremiobacteraeota bacterium]